MRGGKPQPLDTHHAAAGCRERQIEPLPRVWREVGRYLRPARKRRFDGSGESGGMSDKIGENIG